MSRPDPALELEALASVRAELDAGTDPLAIFDVLGIAREEFDGMEEILMASFAEDTDTGRTERIDRYKEIYDARRAAKESQRVGIPEVPDLLSPPESPLTRIRSTRPRLPFNSLRFSSRPLLRLIRIRPPK